MANETTTASAEATAETNPGAELFTAGAAGEAAREARSATETAAAAKPTSESAASTETTPEETALDTKTSLSKDDVVEILREAGLGTPREAAATTATTADAPQMSQEQFNKMFNVWQPSADFLAQLRHEDPATALKAMEQLRDNVIRQALTLAEYRIQQHLEKTQKDFESRLEPLSSYVTERQATDFRDTFFQKYPELEKYEKIVEAVSIKLQNAGFKGKTRDEVMAKYADEAKLVLKDVLSTDAANAGKNGGQSAKTATKSRMSTLTGGGQATAGRAGDSKEVKGPPGVEVFD